MANLTGKGYFTKGHPGFNTGNSKWGFGDCRCGKRFKIVKREHGLQRFCSQSCAMIGNERALGHTVSLEAKKMMSVGWIKPGSIPWSKGKKLGPSPRRGKKNPMLSGSRHWNWQGGKVGEAEKVRKSLEYKAWVKTCLSRDNYTCSFCGKRGGDMHVDHIKPFSKYPDLRLELNNGRTLCVDCHRKTPTYGYNAKYA